MKRKPLQRYNQRPLVQIWLKVVMSFLAISAPQVIAIERMTHLATETSIAGETMDAFVLRLAPKLNKMTTKLRAEVCGTIRAEGDLYVVDVRTYHDLYGCYVERDGLPYLHTHPSLRKDCWTFSKED
ncbi:hypothetical protein [Xanthomonas citri]|uniref:hypothetical protein n=1 Tax=Xanthomonas citri TaxID=346 RepID=UPI001CC05D46|nr:hypothetical protein [Xanthomonas citri]